MQTQHLNQAFQLAQASGKLEAGRLTRGLKLALDVRNQAVSVTAIGNEHYEIFSDSRADWYDIVYYPLGNCLSKCNCMDSKRDYVCKHTIAVMLMVKARQIAAAEAWLLAQCTPETNVEARQEEADFYASRTIDELCHASRMEAAHEREMGI